MNNVKIKTPKSGGGKINDGGISESHSPGTGSGNKDREQGFMDADSHLVGTRPGNFIGNQHTHGPIGHNVLVPGGGTVGTRPGNFIGNQHTHGPIGHNVLVPGGGTKRILGNQPHHRHFDYNLHSTGIRPGNFIGNQHTHGPIGQNVLVPGGGTKRILRNQPHHRHFDYNLHSTGAAIGSFPRHRPIRGFIGHNTHNPDDIDNGGIPKTNGPFSTQIGQFWYSNHPKKPLKPGRSHMCPANGRVCTAPDGNWQTCRIQHCYLNWGSLYKAIQKAYDKYQTDNYVYVAPVE